MKRIYKTNKNRYANNKQLLLGLFFLFIGVNSLMASGLEETNYYTDASLKDVKVLEKSIEEEPIKVVYHLFSHGRSGELYLDGKWLNALEIASFIKKQELSTTITSLNIYGCEFAKGEKGKRAVRYLENELGIQVNASTNITGKNGDWLLEVGSIELIGFKNYQYNLQECGNTGNIVKNSDFNNLNDWTVSGGWNSIVQSSARVYPNLSSRMLYNSVDGQASAVATGLTSCDINLPRVVQDIEVCLDVASRDFTGVPEWSALLTIEINGVPYMEIENPSVLTDADNNLIFRPLNGAIIDTIYDYGDEQDGNIQCDYSQELPGGGGPSVAEWGHICFRIPWNSDNLPLPEITSCTNTSCIRNDGTTVESGQGGGNGDWAIDDFRIGACGIGDNCDSLESIVAVNDNFSLSPVLPGNSVGSVLDNDLINDAIINMPSDVNISVLNDGGVAGVSIDNFGNIVVPVGTTPDVYTLTYQICSDINPTNCDVATATVYVDGDTDNDGILNSVDVDDDNDGILDVDESPNCFLSEREILDFTRASSSLNLSSNNNIQNVIDGNLATFVQTSSNTIYNIGETVFEWEYATEVELSSIVFDYVANGSATQANQGGILQAWDGSMWIDLTGFVPMSQSTATGPNYTFTVSMNNGSYSRYRLIASKTSASGTVVFWVNRRLGDIIPNFATPVNRSIFPSTTCTDDIDGDGIPNYLDLDSDADGCPDAIEGNGTFVIDDLVTDTTINPGNSNVQENLGTNIDTMLGSNTYGVPIVAPSSIAVTQGIGISQVGGQINITNTLDDVQFCSNQILDTAKFEATVVSLPSSDTISYQWQISTDGGATFTDISSESGILVTDSVTSLNVTGVDNSFDGNIYKVVFSSSNNACGEEAEASISINLVPLVSIDSQDTICQNADTIQLSGTPATGGVFSGMGVDSTTGKFHPATADTGTHQLYHTYVDTNGCSSVDTTEVVVIPSQPITLSIDTVSSIVCGEGTFTADFAMTTPSGTAINWTSSEMSAGTGNISEVLTNNTATPKTVSYYLHAESPNGCSEILDTINITVNPKPTVTPNVCEIIVCSEDSAIIDFSSTVSNTTISWTGDNGTSGTGNIREVLTNSGSTNDTVTYSIVGTSSEGCNSDTVSCRVIVKPKPQITNLVINNISCAADTSGSINLTVSGNSLNYIWSNGKTTEDIMNLGSGTYNVTITDTISGCSTDTSAAVVELSNSGLSVNISKQNATFGANCMDGKAFATVSGGTPPYTYSWSNGSTTDSAINLTGSNAGVQYTLTITDSLGCTGDSPYNVIINCDNNCDAVVSTDSISNVDCNGNSTGSATVSASSAANPSATFSFEWKNASGTTVNTTTGVTSSTATGLSQGNYTVSVTIDGLTCQAVNQSITITEPSVLQAGVSGTDEMALNAEDGTASSNPTGGTAPYSYLWDAAAGNATTQTVTGLAPGEYCVTVTDANGCTATGCYTVGSYDCLVTKPQISTTVTDVSCNGGNDGQIIANVTNATDVEGPLTYSWTPSAADTNVISGLTAGNYELTVTGTDGCFETINPIIITEPSSLSASAAVNNVKCKGDTGSIDVSVSGGTSPYSYIWSDDTTITTQDRTGVTSGTYSVVVEDANGCTFTINPIQVSEPSAELTATIDVTNAKFGSNPSCSDGMAIASVSGGTAPYSYVWSSNASLIDTAVGLTGSNAGITYNVTITDANGCSTVESFIVGCDNDCDAVVSTDSISNVDCNGNSTGSATVSASSAANPSATFSFEWKNASGTTVNTTTGVTSSTATGLSQGNYTVSVTIDGLTCQAVNQSITITEPSVLQAGVSGTDEMALNAEDGTASSNPTGGTAPYSYLWDAAAGNATTQTVTGLAPGEYCVTVTDANGCTATGCYTVGSYDCLVTKPQISTTVTDVSCNGGNDGQIIANVTNATDVEGPLTYSWTPSAADTNVISGLTAGNYELTVTGTDGCFETINPIIITEPSSLSASAAVNNVKCKGDTGSIDVSVSGGTSPYSYIWSDDTTITTQDRTGVTSGTYSVVVEDANGCTFTINPIQVSEPSAELTATIDVTNAKFGSNPSCSDGMAIASVSGGTAPYSYVWSSNASLIDTAVGLMGSNAGITYNVTITDANGCSTVESFIIGCDNDCDAVVSTDSISNVDCNGNSTGSATVSASSTANPSATFSFEWKNASGTTVNTTTGVTSSTATGLSQGNYTVSVTIDGLTCQAVNQSITITEPSVLQAGVSGTDEMALNAEDGTASSNPTGGTAPYSYLWDAAAGNATTQTVTGLAPGEYCVTVTDANGCTATGCYTVGSYDCLVTKPQISTTVTDVSCNGGNDGQIIANVTNATDVEGPLTYSWTPSAPDTNVISGLTAGNYELTVTGTDGCFETINPIIITEPSSLSASAAVNNVKCKGDTGSIDVSVSGGTSPYSYIWSDDTTITTQDRTGVTSGTYSVVVEDANGCTFTINPIQVSEPSAELTATIDVTNAKFGSNPSCSDGMAIASVSGGTAPYSYVWSSNASLIDTAVGLMGSNAGITYNVTITDANGCSTVESFIIGCDNDCDAVVSTDSISNVDCNGNSTGSATVSASSTANPSATFSFEWKNASGTTVNTTTGVTSSTATGLSQGNYTVSVTIDGLTCQAVNQSITITEPSVLQAGVSGTDEMALNAEDGTASSSPTGGTAPYSYLWDAAAGNATTQTVTGLAPGEYCVTVTDANGCTATGCYTVGSYDCLVTKPQISTTVTDVSCNGGNDGQIIANVTNATDVEGPLTYSWTPSAPDTNVISGLTAGNYELTVTGTDGCFETINPIIITEPSSLSASAAVNNVKCKGDTGSIDVSVSGGTSPYSYIWSDDTTITTQDRTGVTSGTYSVVVEDANGCTFTINPIQVSEPSAELTATVDATNATNGSNPSCSDGMAIASVSGGTAPYSYVWSSNASFIDTAVGLAGSPSGISYNVTITDANGCSTGESFIIRCNDICNVKINTDSITNVDCNGNSTGTATVSASNTATPDSTFTFVWRNANNAIVYTNSGDTTSTATGLSQGNYTVSVTIDGLTCQAEDQVITITEPSVLQANVSKTDETSLNADDGTVTANPIGGTAPYSYLWDAAAGNDTTASVDSLEPGQYCVTVTDANGCTATGCVTVAGVECVNSSPQVNISIINASCNGENDGQIIANVTNAANVQNPISYTWGHTALDTNIVDSLTAGNYTLTVTGGDGCFTTINPIVVTEPSTLNASAAVDDPNCFGENSGSIDVSVTGGTMPYSFVWSDTSLTSEDRTGVSADTIGLIVTDANGCTFTIDSIFIEQPDEITIDSLHVISNATCGSDNGSIQIETLVANTNYEVQANNGSSVVNFGIFTSNANGELIVTGIAAGSYSNIEVEDQILQCSSNSFAGSFTISEEGVDFGSIALENDTTCLGETYTLSATVSQIGVEVYWRYDSIRGTIISTNQSNTLDINPTDSRCYVAEFVNTNSNCSSFDTICVAVSKAPIANDDACISLQEDSMSVDSLSTAIAANDDYSSVLQGGIIYSVISTINGTTSIDNAAGTITYSPPTNFVGYDTAMIQVCSETCRSLCDTSFICYTVTPETETVDTSTCEECPITLCVPDELTEVSTIESITSCGMPTNGELEINDTTGCITYTPDTNFVGIDTMCVIVCDSASGLCDTTILVIEVTPELDPPMITQDSVTLEEGDTAIICPTVSDPDSGDVLTVGLCGMPVNGTATEGPGNCITYIPNPDFIGNDSICIVVCDQTGLCDSVTVPITVTPETETVDTSTCEECPITLCVPDELTEVSTIESITSCGMPTNGELEINDTTGCITYTPDTNFVGIDTMCVIVCDSASGLCDTTILVIEVTPELDPPMITQDSVTLEEGDTAIICPTVSDPDSGDVLTVGLCGMPVNGTATEGPGNCITYIPNPDFIGNDSICIVVCDQTGLCDSVTVPITVTPETETVDTSTCEECPITLCVPDELTEVSTIESITSCGMPTNGELEINDTTGCITYTPDTNFVGIDTMCVIVCDSASGLCDTTILVIEVTPELDPPMITQDSVTLEEGDTAIICPTVSDPDSGDVLTVGLCGMPVNGTATEGPGNCITYIPNPDFIGNDSICIVVCDQTGLCDSVTVPIMVTPETETVDTSTCEECPITLCVPDELTEVSTIESITSCGMPTNGELEINDTTGCITYTPDTNFVGIDTMCVIVCDSASGLCDTTILVIEVTPELDPPMITQDSVTLEEGDTAIICPTVSDPDSGDVLTVGLCGMPVNGTATEGPGNCITYIPNPDFIGNDSICIVVCDQTGLCDSVTVPIMVTPETETVDTSTCEECPITLCVPDELTEVSTIESITSCGMPTNGELEINDTTGCITYTPDTNFVGIDTMCVIVCDSASGLCDTTILVIEVTPELDPPMITQDSVTLEEGDTAIICPTVSDPDSGDVLTVGLCGMPVNGTATEGPGNCITYIPNPDFIGNDSICIVVCDQTGLCDSVTVPIMVTPETETVDTSTCEECPITLCVPDELTEVSTIESITSCGMPTNGELEINDTTGCITYTPDTNFVGIDTMCVIVCDSASGLCDTTILVIEVTPELDPPMITQDSVTLEEGDTAIICPTVSDPDSGDVLTVGLCGMPVNGTATEGPGNCITYIPNPDFIGNDSICIVVCDQTGLCDSVTVPITVTPETETVDTSTCEECPITLCVPDELTEVSTIESITSCGMPTNGELEINDTTGCITYTPDTNFVGIDTMCVIVCDSASGLCDTTILVIEVTPVTEVIDTNTCEECPITLCVPDPLTNVDSVESITICGMPANGELTINDTTDCITYTPNDNFNGTDTMCVIICDQTSGLCDTTILVITVTPVNDVFAVNDINNTVIDVPVSGNVGTNDGDEDSSILTFTLLPGDSTDNGLLIFNDDGTYTYTPNPGFTGDDEFTYYVCDSSGLCDTASVTIEVEDPSDEGVIANNDNVSTDGSTIEICVLCNDIDLGGGLLDDPTIIGGNTTVNGGTIITTATGEIAYIPPVGYEGVDSFSYYTCNDADICDTAVVLINVNPEADLLDATDDAIVTENDNPVSGNVLDNDIFDTNDTVTVSIVGQPTNGTVTLDSAGNYTYTPNGDTLGGDNFTYVLCNQDGTCDTATVYILVTDENQAPVAINDINNTIVDVATSGDVSTNDSDPNGDDLTFTLLPGDSTDNGLLIFNDDGTYTYTPNPGFTGDDEFTYYVCDSSGLCDTATVNIVIVDDESEGVIVNNDNISTDSSAITICVLCNDTDLGGGTLTTPVVLGGGNLPSNGTATVNPDGTITYIPDSGFAGIDTFTYVTCNDEGICDTALVTIIVDPTQDDLLDAVDDAVVTENDVPVSGSVTDNDIFDAMDTITVALVDGPTNGNVTINPDGSYTYVPTSGSSGTDNFTYVICNQNGVCDTATVYILNLSTNTPPIAVNDVNTTFNDLPVSGSVATNDIEPDGDDVSFTLLDDVSNGTLTLNDDGTYNYTPDAGYTGTDEFTYIICDDGGLCDTATVIIDISIYNPGENNDPVALDDNVVMNGDLINPETITISILSNDFDPDGDSLILTVSTTNGPDNGTIVVNADGTVSYTPNPGFEGEDSFTYIICDGGGLCDEATVTIIVLLDGSVTVDIFAVDDAFATNLDEPITTENVIDNDIFPAGTNVTVSIVNTPTNGSVTLNADGTFEYVPNTGYAGTDQFTYTICDDQGNCSMATVYITITPDAIVAVDDNVTLVNDDGLVINILDNDTLSTGTISINILEDPVNGTVEVNTDGTVTYTPGSEQLLADSFQYIICVNTLCDTAWVYIEGLELIIPTGISPNNDGSNDNFVIENLLNFYPNAELSIFNRWGDEVWRSNGPYQNNWNGINMEGNNLADGTYFLILDFKEDGKAPYSGFVVLYRNK